MVTQHADASSIMGANVDTGAVEDMVRGEYSRSVNERMPRDYVQMYHPDGSTSVVQLPPVGRNGKHAGDRQRKIMHYILNKKKAVKQPDGSFKMVQWWFPSPPEGWKPTETPWRCPVQECTRAGGLKDLLNLWRHIHSKHPGEVELYQGVLTAIKKRLSEATALNLDTLFTGGGNDGEKPLVSEEDLAAAKFEDASALMEEELPDPQVSAAVFNEYACQQCDWAPKDGTERPAMALSMHVRIKHPEVL